MRVLYNTPINIIYGKGTNGFAVGIEVEMETKKRNQQFPVNPVEVKYWNLKGDGSLRNNGHEAVSKILSYDDVPKALDELNKFINMSELDNKSPRTSVHVHVNMGDKTLAQVINMVCMHTLFEDLLLELSGKSRRGNNFAMSSQAAEGFLGSIKSYIEANERLSFNDNDRYASLNLACLRTFGTVEFRSMRGLTNVAEMQEWVDVIKDLYTIATQYKTPKEMLSRSLEDLVPVTLLRYFDRERILEVANSNYSSALAMVYCHSTDWDFTNPECDIRNNDEFFNWWKARGYTERDMMRHSTRDLSVSFKKFLASKTLTNRDEETAVTGWNFQQVRLNPAADDNFWVINDDIEVV